jgi:hypothetical protein
VGRAQTSEERNFTYTSLFGREVDLAIVTGDSTGDRSYLHKRAQFTLPMAMINLKLEAKGRLSMAGIVSRMLVLPQSPVHAWIAIVQVTCISLAFKVVVDNAEYFLEFRLEVGESCISNRSLRVEG